MLTDDEQETLKAVAAGTSSGLSIIGSLYILGRYWYARRKKAKAHELSSLHNLEVTKELIHVLAWLDLVGAIGRIFGTYPTQTFDQDKGEPVTDICNIQAFVITFGDGAPIAWNLVMAFNLFRWICMGEDQQKLQKKIKWYILGTLVFGLTIPTVGLSFHKFGDAGNWCWIVVPGKRAEELWWKLGTLYIWVLLGGVIMAALLVLVKIDMKKRLQSYENEDAREAYNGVVHNLTIYIWAFIVCWLPAVVDRSYSAITAKDLFVLNMFHASIVPLQGFVNAVIYGKFHHWVGRMVAWGSPHDNPKNNNKQSITSKTKNLQREEQERHQMGTASIFVTTFDMNWNDFPTNLDEWIPPKKDLYVFSLQHCIGVQSVEQSIRKYLLRVNYPTAYRSITSLAGSAYRGQIQNASVCQILFVNNADDASGNFQFHASDGLKWAQRKTFKEVAGIPIRYFEASIAFVSCNLSSHHRSQDMDNVVATKHALTTRLIHSFGMDADTGATDFPNLYHHTFLSGNMNYDVDLPKSLLSTSIDQAYKAESLRRATDMAIELKLKVLQDLQPLRRNTDQAIPPGSNRFGTFQRGNSNVPVEWNLLYFSSRNSLERTSNLSSSTDDDCVYREVYSSSCDNLPFTLLESPMGLDNEEMNNVNRDGNSEALSVMIKSEEDSHDRDYHSDSQGRWLSFLDNLFPSSSPTTQLTQLTGSIGSRRASFRNNIRGDNKKISDLLVRSQLVAEKATMKWKELMRYDELRAAIEAKEVFCGFEEPPIQFLPSYPRRVGSSASFAMVTDGSFKDVFAEMSLEPSKRGLAPAYKDRILSHSLQDTKQRLRNIRYWLCEEITTSSHKPVCSLYELEIDRFFSYKMVKAALVNSKDALRDKTGVREFKIKLMNLDANIWTYQAERVASFNQLSPRTGVTHTGRNGAEASLATAGYQSSTSSSAESMTSRRSLAASNRHRSISRIVDRVFGKNRAEPGTATAMTTPTLYSDFASDARGSHPLTVGGGDRLSALSPFHVELVPVNPLNISTIFPLPSEDVYALQRKVYEVAHFVQNGFQSSAVDEEIEESQLAYTNFRTVPWKEAARYGVTHSSVTQPVNGVVHIAITIEAENGHGGQGVLCIKEDDILMHAVPVIGEAELIPFDVTLTWGGKHVGYLHGDILASVM